VHVVLTVRSKLRLTVNDHRNADETGYSSAAQSDTSSAATSRWFPLHQERAQHEGGDVHCCSDKRVDKNVAVQ